LTTAVRVLIADDVTRDRIAQDMVRTVLAAVG
jgi:hypothetical protein